MNAVVTLLVPPFADYTYSLPDEFPTNFWKVGLRVAVPLGHGPLRAGIIRNLTDKIPDKLRLREVCWPLEDVPLLSPTLLSLLEDLAHRQCAKFGAAIALLLPFLKETRVSLHRLDLAGCRKRGAIFSLQALCRSDIPLKKVLAGELVRGRARMLPPRQDAAKGEVCVLTAAAPWPLRPYATLQRKALEYLSFHGSSNRRTLIRELGARGAEVIAQLVHAQLVRVETAPAEDRAEAINEALLAPSENNTFELNSDQLKAAANLEAALVQGIPAYRLLYGVTGSGKTAVYMAAARKALSLGRSVLLLAPEVALAHKLRRDCVQALPGANIIFYHGYQGQAKREATFRSLSVMQTPCIVVGTRSALFLPVPATGLIILDEEHDASFKQDDHVPYQSKEVAWFRATKEKALLVLGTATPELKTWYAAENGLLPVLRLPSRISGRKLPPVELVDISQQKMNSGEGTQLADESIQALDQTVSRGEQAVILLNRRGFAPLIYCPDCRKTLTCPNCAVSLSYHKDEGRLMCHYCGYSVPFPAPCPTCHNMNFLPVGEGTEKLAEYLDTRFHCGVLRLDRDSTRREGAMEQILSAFAHHEAGIIVGTQMLSKGHHFPDVTLALIADGDLGLSMPDYRAAEKTFQLLVQSAGRAGRGDKPGRVLIQTRDTLHYCWQYIRNADYEGFYKDEIERRKKYCYPPFIRLAMIRFSFERDNLAADAAMQELSVFARSQAKKDGIFLLGPVPAPIAYVSNRKRYQCLIKSTDWQSARQLYFAISNRPEASRLRLQLDLDPITML